MLFCFDVIYLFEHQHVLRIIIFCYFFRVIFHHRMRLTHVFVSFAFVYALKYTPSRSFASQVVFCITFLLIIRKTYHAVVVEMVGNWQFGYMAWILSSLDISGQYF
jgi:hypothetical protein